MSTHAASRERALLLAILVVAAAFRLTYLVFAVQGLLLTNEQLPHNDGRYYVEIATNVVSGRGYAAGGAPTAFVTPGYPLFIAAIFALAGPALVWVRLVQVAIGVLVVFMVYRLARRAGAIAAAIAATLAAVEPHFIQLPSVLGNQLAASALLLAVLLAARRLFDDPRSWPWTLALAASLLAGIYVRPQMLVLLAILAAALPFIRTNRRAVLQRLAVAALLVAIGLAPWVARNYLQFGRFVPLASEVGLAVWAPNNEQADKFIEQRGWETPAQVRTMSEMEAMDWYLSGFVKFVTTQPAQFLALQVRKVFAFWNPWPLAGYDAPHWWAHVLFVVPAFAAGAAAFAGALTVWRKHPAFAAIVFPTIALTLVTYTGIHSLFPPREGYRAPLMLLLFVTVGAAGSLLKERA